ncbi:MAG: DUF559 domain-containing protein [Bacteroidota bacterium]
MGDNVEQRLARVINLVNTKIKTYLEVCESPIEKMFLLNYFETIFDSMTGDWFSLKFDEPKGPYFEYPGNEEYGKFYPSGVKWLDGADYHNARMAEKVHSKELYPQYEIMGDDGKIKYRLDFALFYPRFETGLEKLKVAVECDGHDFHEKTKEQAQRDKAKDRFLQSKGWIVARFTGSEIFTRDVYDLISEIDGLVMSKEYEIHLEKEKTKEIENKKTNWQISKPD